MNAKSSCKKIPPKKDLAFYCKFYFNLFFEILVVLISAQKFKI